MVSGTLLNARGEVIPSRSRIIALEVIKFLRNEDGSLPSVTNSSLAEVRQKLEDARGSKLRSDRCVPIVL